VIRLRYETGRRPRRLGRVTLAPGERICRVYAVGALGQHDRDELERWGREARLDGLGLLPERIRLHPLPHFLVWGLRLDIYCQVGLGVELASDDQWRRDIAAWRRVVAAARDFATALE
jgi:hypothetical protein